MQVMGFLMGCVCVHARVRERAHTEEAKAMSSFIAILFGGQGLSMNLEVTHD